VKFTQNFAEKNLWGKHFLEDLSINEKLILKKYDVII
jgi:hypothetical protein